MDNLSLLLMVMLKRTNGFTLLEMLLVLILLSILTLMALPVKPLLVSKDLTRHFKETVLLSQIKAIANGETVSLTHPYDSNVGYLSFNSLGNINQAQTIQVGDHFFIFQLGSGRFYEK